MFPHAGGDGGLAASIDENQRLLRNVLKEAPKVLAPGGELHITLVQRYPYTAWLDGLCPRGGSGGGGGGAGGAAGGGAGGKKTGKRKGGAAAAEDGAAALPLGVAYLGAQPFDFGCFTGYQHRATSKVEGGSAGALDVGTRCSTHVWRLDDVEPTAAAPAAAPAAAAEEEGLVAGSSGAIDGDAAADEPEAKRTKKKKKKKKKEEEKRAKTTD